MTKTTGGIPAQDFLHDVGPDLLPRLTSQAALECQHQSEPFQEHDGIIVILVDDLLEAGTTRHRQKMNELQARFKFGKHLSLRRQPGGALFNGRRLVQKPDYSFTCSMKDYIRDKMASITIPKGLTSLNQAQRELLRT
eukprot:5221249-Amphidinium_carterae.2